MKILYSRVSSVEQNASRQLNNVDQYDQVMTDRCSGSIPLYERPYGKRLKELVDANQVTELTVHSIDRLGRNTIDVLQTWNDLTAKGITVICSNPLLRNFDSQGNPDAVSEMIVSILSIMAKFERKQIKERQAEGFARAKADGKMLGRKPGTKENSAKFLAKPKVQQIIKLLERNYTYDMIQNKVGCSASTIRKIKLLQKQQLT